jgi:4-hydroxybenzoyl-CoA thioesterase
MITKDAGSALSFPQIAQPPDIRNAHAQPPSSPRKSRPHQHQRLAAGAMLTPDKPALPHREFTVERVVRFGDCDPAGIVFFPNYFVMLNSVVEDWWQHLGHPWTDTILRRRMGMPTAHLDTAFVAPSLFGDALRFHLAVDHLGRSALTLHTRVVGVADGVERLRFRQRLVATSLETHRPIAWPDDIRQAIIDFQGGTS